MENLFDLLTAEDKDKIKTYIEFFTYEQVNNLEYVLRFWSQEKAQLFSLLNNSFILKRNVAFSKPSVEIEDEIWRKCMRWDSKGHAFYSNFCNKINYMYRTNEINRQIRYNITCQMLSEECLASNIYQGEDFEWKGIKVKKGTKIMRILQKFADIFDLRKEFEDFRIAHSQTINTKKLTGELCLSIHPLDYMTMSDNSNGWSSCMSWEDDGCYKAGTVEMMNSKCVVVAYLSSADEFEFKSGYFWNNKKWRELFIVDQDIISAVKGYPYHHSEIEKIVIEWLAELAKTNWGMNFIYSERNVRYCTNHMYNDIIDGVEHSRRLFNENCANEEEKLIVRYSGPSICVVCGDTNISDDSHLICRFCSGIVSCSCCGDDVSVDEVYYDDNGNPYCEYCYNERLCHCEGCDEDYFDENGSTSVKVKINENEYIQIELCNDCISMLYNQEYYTGRIHEIHDREYVIDGRLFTEKGYEHYNLNKDNLADHCTYWLTSWMTNLIF